MSHETIVTGGAGFVGSHLVDRLIEQNLSEKIVVVDNLMTGSPLNIAHHDNKRVTLLTEDVRRMEISTAKEIWHLACPASPQAYQRSPVDTFEIAVNGTQRMAQIALINQCPLFHTSTSEVYGDPQISPQDETYWGNVNPIGPRSCYDEGKRAAETLLFDLMRQKGLKLRLVRIFNTYGPRMALNDGRVVSNFIVQALTNNDITVYGDGQQTRSFCFVSDLIDGFFAVSDGAQDESGPFNLGNPSEFTILELAEKVISLTKSKSKIAFKALPQDDPMQRKPQINKIKSKTNWCPKVGLDDGLRLTIRDFRRRLNE
jgi:UDP-glucuronate decarboxylase